MAQAGFPFTGLQSEGAAMNYGAVVQALQQLQSSVSSSVTAQLAFPSGLLYNFNPANYKQTRRALSKLRRGDIAQMQVLCLGDSTTVGYNGTGGGANEKAGGWVPQLATMMRPIGATYPTRGALNGSWQNTMGYAQGGNNTTFAPATIDTRVGAIPAAWTAAIGQTGNASTGGGVGGSGFFNNSDTSQLSFTPADVAGTGITTDTLDLWYYDNSGYDSISVFGGATGVTAASPATVTPGSSISFKKATFTAANTVVWKFGKTNANGANCFIQGWHARNAGTPEISFLNCGNHSAQTGFYNQGSIQHFDPLNSITTYGNWNNSTGVTTGLGSPLVIYMMGINDWTHSQTTAQVYANVSGTVSALQAIGTDVLLIIPPPSDFSANGGLATYAAQQQIVAALYQVANNYNLAVIDLYARFGAYAGTSGSNALGFMGDVVHPSSQGYQDIADAVYQFFLSV